MSFTPPDTPAWQAFCAARGLRPAGIAGRGLDFTVLRMVDAAGDQVAVKVPHARFSSNVNDPHVDRRILLLQEYDVTSHLTVHGLTVARPRELYLSAELDVLVCDHVPDGGLGVDGEALGALLARLHAVPIPERPLVASEGDLTTGEIIVQRVERRWKELGRLHPALPALPALAVPPAGRNALLHMDVRAANLRCPDRRSPVLVDWANALVADPALELARVSEFARIPGNGIDIDGLRRGYGAAPPVPLLYHLDAAVLLALVFRSEAPDPVLGPQWTDRAVTLARRLV
ncbi:MAG TPA: phosphotransferase [Candidatus Limnocylindrales bacterium]|nr:phosphotransferase [Candidatus Limnocylindrales bacterium]